MQNTTDSQNIRDDAAPVVSRLIGALYIALILIVILALPEVIAQISGLGPWVDVIGYGVLTVVLTGWFIYGNFIFTDDPPGFSAPVAVPLSGVRDRLYYLAFKLVLVTPFWVVLYIPLYVILYAESLRGLYMIFGGFSAHTTSFWDWALFGIYWIIDSYGLNTMEIFGWSVTSIHAIAFWAELLVVGLNAMLAVFVVGVIRRIIQRAFRRY
jgi:hypothetical protein